MPSVQQADWCRSSCGTATSSIVVRRRRSTSRTRTTGCGSCSASAPPYSSYSTACMVATRPRRSALILSSELHGCAGGSLLRRRDWVLSTPSVVNQAQPAIAATTRVSSSSYSSFAPPSTIGSAAHLRPTTSWRTPADWCTGRVTCGSTHATRRRVTRYVPPRAAACRGRPHQTCRPARACDDDRVPGGRRWTCRSAHARRTRPGHGSTRPTPHDAQATELCAVHGGGSMSQYYATTHAARGPRRHAQRWGGRRARRAWGRRRAAAPPAGT